MQEYYLALRILDYIIMAPKRVNLFALIRLECVDEDLFIFNLIVEV